MCTVVTITKCVTTVDLVVWPSNKHPECKDTNVSCWSVISAFPILFYAWVIGRASSCISFFKHVICNWIQFVSECKPANSNSHWSDQGGARWFDMPAFEDIFKTSNFCHWQGWKFFHALLSLAPSFIFIISVTMWWVYFFRILV